MLVQNPAEGVPVVHAEKRAIVLREIRLERKRQPETRGLRAHGEIHGRIVERGAAALGSSWANVSLCTGSTMKVPTSARSGSVIWPTVIQNGGALGDDPCPVREPDGRGASLRDSESRAASFDHAALSPRVAIFDVADFDRAAHDSTERVRPETTATTIWSQNAIPTASHPARTASVMKRSSGDGVGSSLG